MRTPEPDRVRRRNLREPDGPRPAASVPPGYGCLSVLLLPVGLWWLAARRGKGKAKGD